MMKNPIDAHEYAEIATNALLDGLSLETPMTIVRWAWDKLDVETQQKITDTQQVVIVDADELK